MIWPSTRTLVLAGVVLIVVLAAAAGGWIWYGVQRGHAEAAHADAMARAAAARAPEATPDAKTTAIRELETVLQRYPSAPTVAQAAFELGNLRYDLKDYAGARATYEIAVARGASATIRTLARAGIGYTWEAERNFAKSAEAFQRALADLKPKDFEYEDIALALARDQELAGRKTDAIETYRKLLRDVPASRRGEDIRTRLAALGATAQ